MIRETGSKGFISINGIKVITNENKLLEKYVSLFISKWSFAGPQ